MDVMMDFSASQFSSIPQTKSLGRWSLLTDPPETHGFFKSNIIGSGIIGYIVLYHCLARQFPTSKQRSWIITCIASALMTIASLPFVWDYFKTWGSVTSLRSLPGWSYATCRIFQAYLVSDLSMGLLYYREHLNVFTGYGHHTFYIWAVNLAVNKNWDRIFCLLALMEFPTFVLSLATLYPKLRSNIFFAVSFFATRILLHLIWCITFFIPRNRVGPANDSIVPAMLLLIVLPLHAMWFKGCINGFIRRSRARKQALASSVPSSPEPLVAPRSSPIDALQSSSTSTAAIPDLELPEPALTPAENISETASSIIQAIADEVPAVASILPETQSPERRKSFSPPSPKALYEFVGLGHNKN